MPSQEFHREIVARAAPPAVWKTLTDVPTLVAWITIVHNATELEPMAHYAAVLQDRMGPFKLRADLDIRLSDVQVENSVHVTAEGEDRQVSSRISVAATLALVPVGGGTAVRVDGRYEVLGRVASMGSGIITKKAETVLNEFFSNAGAALG